MKAKILLMLCTLLVSWSGHQIAAVPAKGNVHATKLFSVEIDGVAVTNVVAIDGPTLESPSYSSLVEITGGEPYLPNPIVGPMPEQGAQIAPNGISILSNQNIIASATKKKREQ